MLERSEFGQFSPSIERSKELTQEYLKEILYYDPETGLWFWFKEVRNSGRLAGSKDHGYVSILINSKKRYLAHRLAFLYMLGRWPEKEVDHKDNVKNNNAWDNLRECTSRQNMANRPASKRNKLGVKGVSYHKNNKYYQVHISLGCYKTLEEASILLGSLPP